MNSAARHNFLFLFTTQLLYVFNCTIPCVDKLKSYHAVIDVAVTKDVRAEAGSHGHVVCHLKIQRETQVPDLEVASQVNAIDF